jgi:hypothetical protein
LIQKKILSFSTFGMGYIRQINNHTFDQCCGSGWLLSGSGYDFSNWLDLDPDPSLYKICTNLSQQEIFYPKGAFKSYLRGKKLTNMYLYLSIHNTFKHKEVKNVSILAASDPDPYPVPNVRNRVRIRPKRSGSDRIRIHNTAFDTAPKTTYPFV